LFKYFTRRSRSRWPQRAAALYVGSVIGRARTNWPDATQLA
jgi:hypothetical protein